MRSNSCRPTAVFLLVILGFGLAKSLPAQSFSPEDLRTRGRQAFEEGRYAEAEREFRRALEGFGKSGDAFELAATRGDLADVLVAQERYQEAEKLLDEAYRTISTGLNKYGREIARMLVHLAALYEKTGKGQVPEAVLTQSVAVLERLEPNDPMIVVLLNHVGRIHAEKDNYKQAQNYLQQALELAEKRSGGDHPDLIPVLVNFAVLYQRQKKWALAESYLVRATGIADRFVPRDHPNRILILERLGVVHYRQNKINLAESEFRLALDIQRRTVGMESFRTVNLSLSLAKVLTEMRRYDEARSLYVDVIPVQERLYGSKTPEVATTLEDFAMLLQTMKNAESAAEMQARARRIRAELSYTRSVKDLKRW